MAAQGDVLDLAPLGLRMELRKTAAQTGGELLEMDVVGRSRGFIAQAHVHTRQTERLEVIEGQLEVGMNGKKHELGPGDVIEVPPGTPHTQRPAGSGEGRLRIQVRPAGTTEEFMRRLAEMSANGDFVRGGWPKPLAAAALVRDFGDEGHAARPSLKVQKKLANALLRAASREYVFVDEWDVAAPPEPVFDALADGRSYPEWWRPVYLDVEAEGEPAVGKTSRQHFKGRLPYHLRTTSKIVEYDPPHTLSVDVDGDLRGHGKWTLTPIDGGTHVRFDWQVFADRPLLRVLTPVLRPAFRWNHNWAIARAMEGLEPYCKRASTA
jgi:quercetin dioxygenase-like cupin family protein/uncharacterized protein YndB with AHSA1/START domain